METFPTENDLNSQKSLSHSETDTMAESEKLLSRQDLHENLQNTKEKEVAELDSLLQMLDSGVESDDGGDGFGGENKNGGDSFSDEESEGDSSDSVDSLMDVLSDLQDETEAPFDEL